MELISACPSGQSVKTQESVASSNVQLPTTSQESGSVSKAHDAGKKNNGVSQTSGASTKSFSYATTCKKQNKTKWNYRNHLNSTVR
eukprot:523349-Rhodomonas_salina.1